MVLRVSEYQSFQACCREVCMGLFCLSYLPVKCLRWLRKHCLHMQMTPHYWQLFNGQQTDLLLLPPLTGTWLGLRSDAITGAWYWIHTKLRLLSLVDPGLWTFPLVTWSCQGFLSEPVPNSTSLAWSLTACSHSKTMCMVLFPVCLRELVFWCWWNVYLWTPLCYFVSILHCSVNLWELFSDVGVSCWMSPSASWAPCIFGGQALPWSEFLGVVSSTSCCWA